MEKELYLNNLFRNVWKNSNMNIFSMVEHLFLFLLVLDSSCKPRVFIRLNEPLGYV